MDKRIIAISGTHGCFGYNTPIRMYDGTIKKVQDILLGDLVMGNDSTPREVLHLISGKEELFEFEYIDGIKHVYNKSHDLVLQYSQTRKSGTTKKVLKNQSTGDTRIITVGEYLKLGKSKRRILCKFNTQIIRPKNTLSIPPYILGAWLGDGTSARPEVTNIDDCIIEELAKFAESCGCMLSNSKNISYSIVTKRGQLNPFLDNLKKYDLLNNKHIPLKYFNACKEDRLELLAGLLDTDGYLDKCKSTYEINQKNKRLAYDIYYLVRSCGLHSTIRKVIKKCTNTGSIGTYYSISITRCIYIIPCKVKRKKAYKNANAKRLSTRVGVRSITNLGIGSYYGFTLDRNNLFLHADGAVLKNCGKSTTAYSLAAFLKKKGKNVVVLNELARECPFDINQDAGDKTQIWLMCKQITKELELLDRYDFVVTDRSVFDAYSYGDVVKEEGNIYGGMYTYLMNHVETFYKQLYVLDPKSFNFNKEDGIRDTDEDFRNSVHYSLIDLLDRSKTLYKLVHSETDIYADF